MTCSEEALVSADCEAYHEANVEFSLVESDCPNFQYFKSLYAIGGKYSRSCIFDNTSIVFNGILVQLKDLSTCSTSKESNGTVTPYENPLNSFLLTAIVMVSIAILILGLILIFLVTYSKRTKQIRRTSNINIKPNE